MGQEGRPSAANIACEITAVCPQTAVEGPAEGHEKIGSMRKAMDAVPSLGSKEKSVGKWSRSEERYFFEHLRFASSNSRERCAGDIAHILGNKSVEQVNKYYDNVVRKLMGYAPAGSNFRQYEVSNIHRSMVFYWDTVLLPSREQRNARANAGAREKGKRRPENECEPEKLSKKRFTAGSNPDAVGRTNADVVSAQNQSEVVGRATCSTGQPLPTNGHAEKLVPFTEAGNNNMTFNSYGNSPTSAVELRLLPADDAVAAHMRRHGCSPSLTFVTEAAVSLSVLLQRLADAWKQAIPDGRGSRIFIQGGPDSNKALRGIKWGGPQCDADIKIGDVLSVLQCPNGATMEYTLDLEPAMQINAASVDVDPHDALRRAIRAVIDQSKSDHEGTIQNAAFERAGSPPEATTAQKGNQIQTPCVSGPRDTALNQPVDHGVHAAAHANNLDGSAVLATGFEGPPIEEPVKCLPRVSIGLRALLEDQITPQRANKQTLSTKKIAPRKPKQRKPAAEAKQTPVAPTSEVGAASEQPLVPPQEPSGPMPLPFGMASYLPWLAQQPQVLHPQAQPAMWPMLSTYSHPVPGALPSGAEGLATPSIAAGVLPGMPYQQQVEVQAQLPAKNTVQRVVDTDLITPAKKKKTFPSPSLQGFSPAGDSILRMPAETWACLSPPPNFQIPLEFPTDDGGSTRDVGLPVGGGVSLLGGASLLPSGASLLGFADVAPKGAGLTSNVMQKGVEALFVQAVGGGTAAAAGGIIMEADASNDGRSNSNWLAAFVNGQATNKQAPVEQATVLEPRPFAILFDK